MSLFGRNMIAAGGPLVRNQSVDLCLKLFRIVLIMKKLLFPILLIGAVMALGLNHLRAEVREWTQAATGNKISAEFVKMKDEKTVTIRMTGGKTFDVAVASLSEADQEFIKSQMAGASESASTDAPKETAGKPGEIPEGEVTVTLSGVHMCCKGCVEAVEGIKENEDIKVVIDEEVEFSASRSDKTITIKAPSGKAAQGALKAVVAAGYYGESDHSALKIDEAKGKGSDFTTKTVQIRDVHLCCGSCVKAVKKAVESVDGVDDLEVKSGAKRFTVTSEEDFKPYDILMALRAAGFGGTWQ